MGMKTEEVEAEKFPHLDLLETFYSARLKIKELNIEDFAQTAYYLIRCSVRINVVKNIFANQERVFKVDLTKSIGCGTLSLDITGSDVRNRLINLLENDGFTVARDNDAADSITLSW